MSSPRPSVAFFVLGASTNSSPFGLVWALNRAASELPRNIGFNPAWMAAATNENKSAGSGSSSTGASGGRGRRGSSSGSQDRGGAGPFTAHQESYEDAQRVRLLTADARNPPARLIIVDRACRRDDDERAWSVADATPERERGTEIQKDRGRAVQRGIAGRRQISSSSITAWIRIVRFDTRIRARSIRRGSWSRRSSKRGAGDKEEAGSSARPPELHYYAKRDRGWPGPGARTG